jgi:hypothetical protein
VKSRNSYKAATKKKESDEEKFSILKTESEEKKILQAESAWRK